MPKTEVATRETTSQTDSLLLPPPAPAPPERFASEMVTTRSLSVALTMTPRAEQPVMKRENESGNAADAKNSPQLAASAVGVEKAGKGRGG